MGTKTWTPKSIDWSPMHNVLIKDEDGTMRHADEPYYASELIAPGTWIIHSDGDRTYLVEGDNEAIVIDSGYGSGNLREYCQSLTDKPVNKIINTHDHFDHTANNCYFDCAYMAQESLEHATVAYNSFSSVDFPMDYPKVAVDAGYIFDLGGRTLEVFKSNEHTAGCIMLLDTKERILFSGDEFLGENKPLFRTVENWANCLRPLAARRADFDVMWPGPGMQLPADVIDRQLACCEKILNGAQGNPPSRKMGGPPPWANKPQELGPNDEMIYARYRPHPGDSSKVARPKRDPEDWLALEYEGLEIMYGKDAIYDK